MRHSNVSYVTNTSASIRKRLDMGEIRRIVKKMIKPVET